MMFIPNQYYYPYNAYNNFNTFNMINAFNTETSQRTRFTKEEDELLRQLVNSNEQPNWNEVARHMKNRTARQCRERYNNYLRPNLVNGPWTREEDELLLELYEKYGPKWSLISQSFNSRSPVNVKNHHSSLVSQSIVKSRKNRMNEINYDTTKIIEKPIVNNQLASNPINEFNNELLSNKNQNEAENQDQGFENMFSTFQNQEDLWSKDLAPTFGDDILAF